MEYLFLYLLQIIDVIETIQITTGVLVFLTTIVFVVMAFSTRFEFTTYKGPQTHYDMDKDFGVNCSKWCKKYLTIFGAIFLLCFFIPTKNTTLMLGGLFLGKKAVNYIATDEKLKKIDTIISLELDKRIKEIQREINITTSNTQGGVNVR